MKSLVVVSLFFAAIAAQAEPQTLKGDQTLPYKEAILKALGKSPVTDICERNGMKLDIMKMLNSASSITIDGKEKSELIFTSPNYAEPTEDGTLWVRFETHISMDPELKIVEGIEIKKLESARGE